MALGGSPSSLLTWGQQHLHSTAPWVTCGGAVCACLDVEVDVRNAVVSSVACTAGLRGTCEHASAEQDQCLGGMLVRCYLWMGVNCAGKAVWLGMAVQMPAGDLLPDYLRTSHVCYMCCMK